MSTENRLDAEPAEDMTGLELAIVGTAFRLPGADDLDTLWHNLDNGIESIKRLTREEALALGDSPENVDLPTFVPACPTIEDLENFDAGFFGVSPREAEVMDPQQRLFLQTCWHALEDAGYDPKTVDGPVGIYAGCKMSTYLFNLYTNPEVIAAVGELGMMTGNDKDYIATRIAYKLDLGGPAVAVQTACSTSLVAVHLASQGLLSGECDMALAGAVSLRVPQGGYVYREGEVVSPDGHIRAFDADARGTVFGNGLGLVVLKRLEDAQADGDHIYAVIKGSAVTNDGALKVGFTAPGADGQERVVRAAQLAADVHPETITYVEAHGTGTEIGDPIEVGALTRVFREKTDAVGYCALGSVKTNVGHLNAAAGIASLAKVLLAFRHEQIPGTLHFESPNPQLALDSSPFFVHRDTREFPRRNGSPLRAGVSSFGIGGTNAHLILEEPPARESIPATSRRKHLLVLSARTAEALDAMTVNLAAHLRDHRELDIADAAYTLQVGRRRFEHRRMLVAADRDDAIAVLEGGAPQRLLGGHATSEGRPLVFMFSGQGAQYAGMGAALYRDEPVFRDEIDRCAETLAPHLGLDLRPLLFPEAERRDEAQAQLSQTRLTQPALFVVEWSLARLWMSWGLEPEAMIGHSIGEYVAAALAEVFTLEQALELVATRGRLMQSLPPGAMLAVPLSEDETLPWLDGQLSVAAINAPGRCVVSGPEEAVAALEARLAEAGHRGRRLVTSHAFHSPMMEPILAAFVDAVTAARPQPPKRPFASNVTGTWISAEDATDPGYWARHLRGTVRFADGLGTILRDAAVPQALVEVGPGNTLATLARRHGDRQPEHVVLASLPHAKEAPTTDDAGFLLGALGQLWLAGVDLDWATVAGEHRRPRVSLPGYPFQGQRYWLERRTIEGGAAAAGRKKADLTEWLYTSTWKPSIVPVADASADLGRWLVFTDPGGPGTALVNRLRTAGHQVVTVVPGDAPSRDGDRFVVRMTQREDHDAVLAQLASEDRKPQAIVHLWGLGGPEGDQASALEAQVARGFWSLLSLAQAIGKNLGSAPLRMVVATDRARRVLPADLVSPWRASALGPCRVIPQEYPDLAVTAVDVEQHAVSDDGLAEIFVTELTQQTDSALVAYRGGARYVRGYDVLPIDKADPGSPRLRSGGTYLITGGLGGFGLTFAEHLAEAYQANLVLIGRSALPAVETWDGVLAQADDDDRTAGKIRTVRALEAHGAKVIVRAADVTDAGSLATVVAEARSRFGQLDGVIHAAGIAGGGMIQLKDPQVAAGVLAAKVQGTAALAEALAADPEARHPDFVMLCSSTIAVLGGVGQVDYCAGNNVLDAFAESRSGRSEPTYWVSVNWSGWQDVGMAVDAEAAARPASETSAVEAEVATEPAGQPVGHPVLTRRFTEDGKEVYAAEVGTDSHWLLDEHRIAGRGAIPGTTYLELARAAAVDLAGGGQAELRQVYFLTPLITGDGERRSLRVELEAAADGHRFRVVSRPAGTATPWQEHTRGLVKAVPSSVVPTAADLGAIAARCQQRTVDFEPGNQLSEEEGRLVTWGPRWQSLRRLRLGDGEALADLILPEDFLGDLETYGLHPALLDVATAITSGLGDGGEYLPLSYGTVRTHGTLTGTLHSHLRRAAGSEAGGETVSTDIQLLDREGRVLVEIERFTMKRVGAAAARLEGPATAEAAKAPPAAVASKPSGGAAIGRFNVSGMKPHEGVEMLRRILTRGRQAQIVASPTDLYARLALAEASRRDTIAGAAGGAARQGGNRHPRPSLPTPFVAPRSDAEETLAAVWQSVLGIDEVGVHDNFFELGGDSVMGIQVIAGAGEAGLTLTPEHLFEHQTIAELAVLAADEPAAEPPASADTAMAESGDSDLSAEDLDEVLAQLEG